MSFFRKMLGQEIECIVPENCFRIAYNEKIGPHYYGYIQTLEAGGTPYTKELADNTCHTIWRAYCLSRSFMFIIVANGGLL